jgi:hypothetical protein
MPQKDPPDNNLTPIHGFGKGRDKPFEPSRKATTYNDILARLNLITDALAVLGAEVVNLRGVVDRLAPEIGLEAVTPQLQRPLRDVIREPMSFTDKDPAG